MIGPGGNAASDGVAVSTVGGERVVVGAQGDAERGGRRFHAGGEVARALDEVLQEQVVEPLLELADLLLAPVELQPGLEVDVGIVQCRVERLRQDHARRQTIVGGRLSGNAHCSPPLHGVRSSEAGSVRRTRGSAHC